jgi:hypothetical protein
MSKKVAPIPLEKVAVIAEVDNKKDPAPALDDHEPRFLAIEDAVSDLKISMANLTTEMKTSNANLKTEMKTSMARLEDLILSSLHKSDASDSRKKSVLEDSNSADEDFIAPLDTSAPFVMPVDVSTSIIGNPVPIPFDVQPANRRFHIDVPEVPSYHMAFQDNDRRKSAGDFFDKHLSTTSYMEAPMNAGYIRTLHAIDPHKSGVSFSHLDLANFFS